MWPRTAHVWGEEDRLRTGGDGTGRRGAGGSGGTGQGAGYEGGDGSGGQTVASNSSCVGRGR